jgi:hypothetical protein
MLVEAVEKMIIALPLYYFPLDRGSRPDLQSTELQLPGQLQLFQHFQPGQI